MLTPEQQQFATRCFSRWAHVKAEHEDPEKCAVYQQAPEMFQQWMVQIAADIDHSDLLQRLLRGEEPY